MILRIDKNKKNEDKFWFEGYYIHPELGLVSHREGVFQEDYVLENRTRLNGMYKGILIKENRIEAWVDRYRSTPIFYVSTEQCVFIGSDFFELYKACSNAGVELTIDNRAANNFIRFGYIPHEDTLINEIKEIPCGTVMKVDGSTLEIEMDKYWEFKYEEDKEFDYKNEKNKLKSIYDDVFRDLCKYINRNNKEVNFALSGGLDSRVVLAGIMKFIHNKKSISLNTFGSIYSEDVQIPYKLAAEHDLNLNHFCISEYENMFKENDIMTNATQGRSLSHYQDGFPLVEGGKIKKDSLWLFGHTGDFIGGGHISRKAYYAPFDKYKNKFNELILDKHSFDKRKNKFYTKHLEGEKTKENLLSELDRWDMENRQSRFIINDCATYRQYDSLVMLPLWDNRIVDYFLRVPFSYKVEKVIYNDASIEFLKEMNLHKYLSKSYYKKDSLVYLVKNKIKILTQSADKFMLSHGFNVYFTRDHVKRKFEKIIDNIGKHGVEIEEYDTTHFNYYLALIELDKIFRKLKGLDEPLDLEGGRLNEL